MPTKKVELDFLESQLKQQGDFEQAEKVAKQREDITEGDFNGKEALKEWLEDRTKKGLLEEYEKQALKGWFQDE